jgi:hypothetical protein
MALAKDKMIVAINAPVPQGYDATFTCPSTFIKIIAPKPKVN